MPDEPASPDLPDRLAAIAGTAHVLTASADTAPYLTDWRGAYRGTALAVVKPGTTDEVAALVRACTEAGVAIVPQGGNTGLVGGATPDASGRQVVLSLARLNRVRALDLANDSLTVEAGCILADLQRVAREHGRLFPVSLAAEGSCQIGGNLSTNAGGVQVLRYGNTRDQVLGLEVVLADGRIWDGLAGLRKDNTGYDLKHLFIGAEGTLGVITAAVLKLYPAPKSKATAWLAVADPAAAVALLGRLRDQCGERLSAFEIAQRICLDLVLAHIPGTRDPFASRHDWYALVELTDSSVDAPLAETLERVLDQAAEAGEVRDAVISQSESQAAALWALRENISEAQRLEGPSIKHDISLPVSRIPEFIAQADAALGGTFPGVRIVCFGHIGDGNLHYNCSKAERQENRAFIAVQADVNRIVYDLVARFGGSISAEHGIGQLKRDILPGYKNAVGIDLMRAVKQALDPRNLMNPGKLLP